MLSSAQRYVAAVIAHGKVEAMLKHGPVRHLFKGEEEKLWNYFDQHVKKYGTVPDFALVKADTGFDLAAQTQPAEFYLDRARENHVQQALLGLFHETHEKYLKQGGKPSEGLKALGQAVMDLSVQNMGQQVHDFRKSKDLIMQAYKAKMVDSGNMGLRLGWPTLDEMTGGLVVGDLISFVGRPASGKTWFTLWSALTAWGEQKKPVLFISMEITPLVIEQRLLAIKAKLPFKGIKDAALSTKHYKHMQGALTEIEGFEVPFWVVDGNLTASVEDMYALVRSLKPEFAVADGAYLFTHPTERDRYKRVAENATLIKQSVCSLCPTAASWQFARPPKGQKKGQAQSLDDIGYTDAIGQLSSLALGILQEESAETSKEREVAIIKGRSGETGSFKVNWNFDWTTDFSEIPKGFAQESQELYVE